MRLQIPIAIGFVAGVFMFVQFFIPHQWVKASFEDALDWAIIIGAFALVLGLGSLFHTHIDKIRHRREGFSYSFITLISFAVMFFFGIFYKTDPDTVFDWLFMNVQVPLEATMFSLLAFFIASAAYRTFRARSLEATLLLSVAVIVMLGRVPISDKIPYVNLHEITEWIMMVPTVAAKRGILFGVALGAVATALRIILGLERSHLGGGGGQ